MAPYLRFWQPQFYLLFLFLYFLFFYCYQAIMFLTGSNWLAHFGQNYFPVLSLAPLSVLFHYLCHLGNFTCSTWRSYKCAIGVLVRPCPSFLICGQGFPHFLSSNINKLLGRTTGKVYFHYREICQLFSRSIYWLFNQKCCLIKNS